MNRIYFALILMFQTSVFAKSIQIVDVIFDPVAISTENKQIKLLKKLEINQNFKIKTNENQFVKIKMNDAYILNIYNNTEVQVVSSLSTDNITMYSVQIKTGQVYIHTINSEKNEVKAAKNDYLLQLESDFFDWQLSIDHKINLLINYDSAKAQIDFCNKADSFDIALFNHEKVQKLQALQSVAFQGITENNKLAFDILLKGRKIPKGLWQEPKLCSFTKIEDLEKKLATSEIQNSKSAIAILRKKNELKKFNDAKYLCHNPYGQMNECSWVLSGQKCYRTRCDAGGQWSDRQQILTVTANGCSKSATVTKCDY